MARKNIVIDGDNAILFNKAKGVILVLEPRIKKLTDNEAMKHILKKFLESGINGATQANRRTKTAGNSGQFIKN